MKNNLRALAAAIAVCAGPSGVVAQNLMPGRPDVQPPFQGGDGPGLAPPGAAIGRPLVPPRLQQLEQDRHDYLHGLGHVAHAGHIFSSHGEERMTWATGVPPTRFTVAEASFNPTATRRFASVPELAPALRTSEPAIGLFARCASKLKAILVGTGGALAAIFGALSRKEEKASV